MHLGIIKITYNRTATHFMDDSFVKLGDEVIHAMWAIATDSKSVLNLTLLDKKHLVRSEATWQSSSTLYSRDPQIWTIPAEFSSNPN